MLLTFCRCFTTCSSRLNPIPTGGGGGGGMCPPCWFSFNNFFSHEIVGVFRKFYMEPDYKFFFSKLRPYLEH